MSTYVDTINYAEAIEHMAGGETILAIVPGAWNGSYRRPPISKDLPQGELLSWDEVKPFFDYLIGKEFNTEGLHFFTAWTESWIIFASSDDGHYYYLNRLPRNPALHDPDDISGEVAS